MKSCAVTYFDVHSTSFRTPKAIQSWWTRVFRDCERCWWFESNRAWKTAYTISIIDLGGAEWTSVCRFARMTAHGHGGSEVRGRLYLWHHKAGCNARAPLHPDDDGPFPSLSILILRDCHHLARGENLVSWLWWIHVSPRFLIKKLVSPCVPVYVEGTFQRPGRLLKSGKPCKAQLGTPQCLIGYDGCNSWARGFAWW